MADSQKGALHGWKEIAAHVRREVRTVQRWEKQRGLPVRRIAGAERGNVYALVTELDEWLHSPARAGISDPAEEALHPLLPEPALRSPLNDLPALPVLPVRLWPRISGLLFAAAVLLMAFSYGLAAYRNGTGAGTRVPRAEQRAASRSPDQDALYLQGVYLLEKRTPTSIQEAKQVFLDLTAMAPQDASAWSGLAQTLTILNSYGLEATPETQTRALLAAGRASELNPTLAEPHAVRGFAAFFWKANPREARAEFQQALLLDPKSATTRNWYGLALTYEGRYTEALDQLNLAQRLEPASAAVLSSRALAIGLSGHRDEALAMLDLTQGPDAIPSVMYARTILARINPRNPSLMLDQEAKLAVIAHCGSLATAYTDAARAYRRAGEPAMWRSILTHGRPALPDEQLAAAHVALGETGAAMNILASGKGTALIGATLDPLLTPIRDDPRFQQILLSRGMVPKS